MPLPERKHLTRLNRVFRLPVGDIYLLTMTCANRRPLFTNPRYARIAIETFTDYAARHAYGLLLYTLMADHMHAVLAASDESSGLSRLMNCWESWCTRKLREPGVTGDVWQKEFFDHRIRSAQPLADKCEYIVHNPVRAGLVEKPEHWPHTGGEWWEAYLARRIDTHAGNPNV
jgi:putative transposase